MIFDFVKQRRKELNMSQVELANKACIPVSVIKRFEAKRPYNPSVRKFLRLCHALEIDCNRLADYDGQI